MTPSQGHSLNNSFLEEYFNEIRGQRPACSLMVSMRGLVCAQRIACTQLNQAAHYFSGACSETREVRV